MDQLFRHGRSSQRHPGDHGCGVSIPVVVDQLFRRSSTRVALQPISQTRFNPCCSGSALQTTGSRSQGDRHEPAVSIPVVVDQLFRRSRSSSWAMRGLPPSFNPCCSGSALQTSRRCRCSARRRWPAARVSIPVVVDQLFRLPTQRETIGPVTEFQSLL